MIFWQKFAKLDGLYFLHYNTFLPQYRQQFPLLKMTTNQPSNTPALSKDLELPHNIPIEQAVLSALMNMENSFDKVAGVLDAEDFYGERHKHIFRTIAHLAATSQPYDSLTVFESLARQELLAVSGGESYLMQIEQSTGTMFNLENYAEKVKELSTYRKLITTANQMLEMAYRPKERTLNEIMDSAESQIFAINESLHKREGKQGVKDGLTMVQEVNDYLISMSAKGIGALVGLDTSFEELNNKIQGLQKGHLLILAARPGMGKTTFALNLVQSVLQQDQPVVMFSMEMTSTEIVLRMLSAWGRVPLSKLLTGDLTENEWGLTQNGIGNLTHKKIYIDDRNGLTPSEVRSVCRKLSKLNPETGLGLIVVDYLQLMQVPSKSANKVQEVAEISRSLKALAREMDCPVLALSQLSRDVEKRPNKRPLASDLRESGSIEQDADLIMFIYRDEVYYKEKSDNKGVAEIIIEKNRHGATGKVMLNFEGNYSRFTNLMHAIPDSYGEDE